MDASSIAPSFIGRCLDAALPLVLGVIGLLYYPHKVANYIKSGRWSESEGRKNRTRGYIACGLIVLFGVLQIIWLFD
jgi:hypothetical protein